MATTRRRILWGTVLLVLIISSGLGAKSYYFANKKLHPINTGQVISLDDVANAAFANQQRIENIQVELHRLQKENAALKEELRQQQSNFERFKEFYFRRM